MHCAVRRLVLVIAVSSGVLTGCGMGSKPGSPTRAATATTTIGVAVSGAFGTPPKVTVPAGAAPVTLSRQVIDQGTGRVVAKGDTLIVNYLGQTWAAKNGKVHVFDSSFAHGAPTAFVIGGGKVIPGWDKTLVGERLGSRLVLTVPPTDGYGTGGQSSAGISGTDTLVFVVDLIAAYKPNASAPGSVVKNLPVGSLPRITNVAGRKPEILSTVGVRAPTEPVSTLVVAGSGASIDAARMLVLQFVQTDLATGTKTQATWGQGPQTVPGKNILKIADKLTGQRIGSRVIVLLPATAATPATSTQPAQPAVSPQVLVIDVVGQF